jgi:pyruvate/2-oxoglutarate dehydrogenase complex dihydrolipoamide acyltransferase (E2) component
VAVVNFPLPDVGEGLTEAEIVQWRVKKGDTVAVNDILVEIETAKSLVELPSPFAGTIVALLAGEGDTVPVGTPIIQVDSAGTASKYYDPTDAYELSNPKGLAWGPGGVYAANYGNSTVSVVTPLEATVFASSSPTKTFPTDVAFDELGNLFVSNFFNNTISKYDANGNLLLSFSTGTYAPLWLAFDRSDVPEIDPASAGSACALCAGVLALLERRRRPGAA